MIKADVLGCSATGCLFFNPDEGRRGAAMAGEPLAAVALSSLCSTCRPFFFLAIYSCKCCGGQLDVYG
jgi:hypothetical protein